MTEHDTYPAGECTRFVADNWGGNVGPVWGDAAGWLNSARAAGYVVTASPQPGAIVVWAAGQGGASRLGHVAILESTQPFTVRESNWTNSGREDTRVVDAFSMAGIAGYVLPILVEGSPMTDPERADLADALTELAYAALPHRDAEKDPGGRDYWRGRLAQPGGLGAAMRAFVATPEVSHDLELEGAELAEPADADELAETTPSQPVPPAPTGGA